MDWAEEYVRQGHHKPRQYIDEYERVFAHLRGEAITLLELGVAEGGSLRLWSEWFPAGRIIGVDVQQPEFEPELLRSDRVAFFQGSQDDTGFLDDLAANVAPDGFDVIIDDAAHVGRNAQVSFWHLFPRYLKPGGVYVIEDWGTGYWPSWPDGARFRGQLPPRPARAGSFAVTARRAERRLRRMTGRGIGHHSIWSHQSGMVGVVKQLIDAVAELDIRRENPEAVTAPLRVERLEVRLGQVFVTKTQ